MEEPVHEPVYERLIPDPREELMGNEWDLMDEHPSNVGGFGGAGGAGAVDDDIERAILESMKHHNDNYVAGGSNMEDEILARVLEESRKQGVGKKR